MKGLKEFFNKKYSKELRKAKKIFKKQLAKGLEKYYSNYTDDLIARFSIKRIAKGNVAVTGSISKKNSRMEDRYMKKILENVSYKDVIIICAELLAESGFSVSSEPVTNTIETEYPFEFCIEGAFS